MTRYSPVIKKDYHSATSDKSEESTMSRIDKEIMINAPLEDIFDFVIKPGNLLQIWPSLIDVKDELLLPNQGYSAVWTYKMAGVCLEGKARCTIVEMYQWFSVEIHGAIDSTMTWTFRTRDHINTKVTITVDYRVPLSILGRLAEMIIVKINERETELVLTNLQTRLEKK